MQYRRERRSLAAMALFGLLLFTSYSVAWAQATPDATPQSLPIELGPETASGADCDLAPLPSDQLISEMRQVKNESVAATTNTGSLSVTEDGQSALVTIDTYLWFDGGGFDPAGSAPNDFLPSSSELDSIVALVAEWRSCALILNLDYGFAVYSADGRMQCLRQSRHIIDTWLPLMENGTLTNGTKSTSIVNTSVDRVISVRRLPERGIAAFVQSWDTTIAPSFSDPWLLVGRKIDDQWRIDWVYYSNGFALAGD